MTNKYLEKIASKFDSGLSTAKKISLRFANHLDSASGKDALAQKVLDSRKSHFMKLKGIIDSKTPNLPG